MYFLSCLLDCDFNAFKWNSPNQKQGAAQSTLSFRPFKQHKLKVRIRKRFAATRRRTAPKSSSSFYAMSKSAYAPFR